MSSLSHIVIHSLNHHPQGFKWKPTVSLTSSFNASQMLPTKSKSGKPKKSAGDPCSQWYPGNRPFQAPEVNHIASYIETLPNLKAFVDLRSYGQMCKLIWFAYFLSFSFITHYLSLLFRCYYWTTNANDWC